MSMSLTDKEREAINQRDLEIISANADYLNQEMEDVLQYQAEIDLKDLDRKTFDLLVKVPISSNGLEP
jgi:hypothetical protein